MPAFFTKTGNETWTDYLAQQPYVDYTVSIDPQNPSAPAVIKEQMRYLAGFGVHAQQTLTWGTGSQPVVGQPVFLHGDLTRSTMLTTTAAGGGGTGRFVQRDPIGLAGGLNVYVYCDADPLSAVDVQGLYTFGGLNEYWTRKTPEQAYIDFTGGNDSWMDDPRTVAKVRWCIDVSGTLVTWFAPEIGVVKWIIKIGGRTITIIKWIINGVEVWLVSE